MFTKKTNNALSESMSKQVCEKAAQLLYEYCRKYGIRYVVTGISGGLDSAVTAGLSAFACRIAKENDYDLYSIGLIMPCQSDPKSERLARKAIKQFGLIEIYQDFTEIFDEAMKKVVVGMNSRIVEILKQTGGQDALLKLEWSQRIASGNIKARLRMMFGTYHTARMLQGIVLSTDNLSEYWMAFSTLHGDVGDFGMIQNILKGSEIYDIARYLGVDQEIIDAKPDDGLGIAGGDADQLGAEYPVVDEIIIGLVQAGFDIDGDYSQLENLPKTELPYDDALIFGIAKRCLMGQGKRNSPLNLTREELGLLPIGKIA